MIQTSKTSWSIVNCNINFLNYRKFKFILTSFINSPLILRSNSTTFFIFVKTSIFKFSVSFHLSNFLILFLSFFFSVHAPPFLQKSLSTKTNFLFSSRNSSTNSQQNENKRKIIILDYQIICISESFLF